MNKKSFLIAALAIGAVLLVIGSSVVRCSIAETPTKEPESEITQEIYETQEEDETYPIMLLSGTNELYNMFEKSQTDFEQVISDYAQIKFPQASTAIWDCQVWIDFAAGTYLTNFTLNDSKSTIVTVMLDRTGKLSVL